MFYKKMIDKCSATSLRDTTDNGNHRGVTIHFNSDLILIIYGS